MKDEPAIKQLDIMMPVNSYSSRPKPSRLQAFHPSGLVVLVLTCVCYFFFDEELIQGNNTMNLMVAYKKNLEDTVEAEIAAALADLNKKTPAMT